MYKELFPKLYQSVLCPPFQRDAHIEMYLVNVVCEIISGPKNPEFALKGPGCPQKTKLLEGAIYTTDLMTETER